MSNWDPPVSCRVRWALAYLLVAAGSAVLATTLVGFPLGDVHLPFHLGQAGFWALIYGISRLPVAVLEVWLLVFLHRRRARSWLPWGLGVALPVALELIWHALFGGTWLGEAWARLWLVGAPPEYLLPLDLILRNAVAELTPPVLAGSFVTWLVRRRALAELCAWGSMGSAFRTLGLMFLLGTLAVAECRCHEGVLVRHLEEFGIRPQQDLRFGAFFPKMRRPQEAWKAEYPETRVYLVAGGEERRLIAALDHNHMGAGMGNGTEMRHAAEGGCPSKHPSNHCNQAPQPFQ